MDKHYGQITSIHGNMILVTFEGNIIKLGEENLVQLNNINAESLSSSDFTELYN